MTDRDGTVVICAPGPLTGTDIAGTETDSCVECECEILVAPTGRNLQRTAPPPVRLLCISCGMAMIATDPDPELLPPTEDQKDELARHREHNA